MEISETAQELFDAVVPEHKDKVSVDDFEAELDTYVNEFQVPLDQARSSVRGQVATQAGVSKEELFSDIDDDGRPTREGTPEQVLIGDLDEPDEWVTIEAQVDTLWDSENLSQTGLIRDQTGRTKFTVFDDDDIDTFLAPDTAYRFENVVTDEYNGQINIKLTESSSVEELDEFSANAEFVGYAVSLSGSGLINRCPEEGCTRTLSNDQCQKHGPQPDGEDDLRLKLILDTGTGQGDFSGRGYVEAVCGRELTEALTGLRLEEALEIARDELDRDAATREMRSAVIGRQFRVVGGYNGDYNQIYADDIEEVTQAPETDDLLVRARSL